MPKKPPIHRDPSRDAALRADQMQRDRQRGSPSARGYGRRWARAAKWYLRRHPLCAQCRREDEIHPATEVDHIVPRRLGGADDVENLQALCKSHHSRKTAREDGGFGHRRATERLEGGMGSKNVGPLLVERMAKVTHDFEGFA